MSFVAVPTLQVHAALARASDDLQQYKLNFAPEHHYLLAECLHHHSHAMASLLSKLEPSSIWAGISTTLGLLHT